MLIRHPDVACTMVADTCFVEDRETRLAFVGPSALAAQIVWDRLDKASTVTEVAVSAGYSPGTTQEIIDLLVADGFVLDLSTPSLVPADEAIARVRACARFWNRHIMSQAFPTLLFSGQATKPQVLGWGIEFFIFVRAAREYMARGASRIDGPTKVFNELWDHFAEEAFHDEIFLKGLVGCGLSEGNVLGRVPLPSTTALLNFLWEASEASDLDYAAVFAVMQPRSEPATRAEIADRYSNLKLAYPYAEALFDAFEAHDLIDVALEHSSLTIEPLLRHRQELSRHEMARIYEGIRTTAHGFNLFFRGIAQHYTSDLAVSYRQIPTVDAMLLAS